MTKFTLRPTPNVSSTPKKRAFMVGGAVVGAVAIAALVWFVWFRDSKTVIPSTNPSTVQPGTPNAQPSNPSDKTPGGSGGGTPPSSSNETPSGSTPLKAPSGSFVSNHQPSLSGTDAPSQVQSVCNTSVGAQCEITFKKGNEIKSLGKQTVDAEGNSYWTWDVNTAGLSVGTWTITATATLNNETQTTNDQINLEVQP